jgi:hypothetical protein
MRVAGALDLDDVTAVVAAACADDPIMVRLLPDATTRREPTVNRCQVMAAISRRCHEMAAKPRRGFAGAPVNVVKRRSGWSGRG